MATKTKKATSVKRGSASKYDQLIEKIKNRKAHAAVIGLGYVGLPLAMALIEAGFKVTGYDISRAKVKMLNSGKSDIDDIPDSVVKDRKSVV